MSRNVLYRFESCSLDATDRIFAHRGHPVHLTPKEFDLLSLLVASSGRIVTKEEIHHAVWRDTAVEDGNLTQTICLLRKVLHEAGVDDPIETLPRHGYRFRPKVTLSRPPATRTVLLRAAVATLLLALWSVFFYWLGARA